MNPIVEPKDFIDEFEIVNTDKDNVREQLERLINKYQAKVLNELLGPSLLATFELGVNISPPAQQWADLSLKIKPVIIGIVYYWYNRKQATLTSSLGEVKGKPQNSTIQSSVDKMVFGKNAAADSAFECAEYITNNIDLYGFYYLMRYRLNCGWGNRFMPDVFQKINDRNI